MTGKRHHGGGRRVLLSGFGAFPGVAHNATQDLVPMLAALAARQFPEHSFAWEILDVDWEDGPAESRRVIERFAPSLIIHFGVSELARGFVVERLAHNICRDSLDAGGKLPRQSVLDAGQRPVLESTLPCTAIVDRLRQLGLPAELSQDAGAYLCNAVLFETLRRAHRGVRAGFIHVPAFLPLERGTNAADCMTIGEAVQGGLELLGVCLEDSGLSTVAGRA